jgi:hypothetical protein
MGRTFQFKTNLKLDEIRNIAKEIKLISNMKGGESYFLP